MSRRKVTGRLGEVVRSRRQQRGMTQEELAEEIGVTQAYVSSMEMGRVQLPNTPVRRALARALGMGHLELLVRIGELEVWEVPGTTPPAGPGLSERVRAVVERAVAEAMEDQAGGMPSSASAARKRARDS